MEVLSNVVGSIYDYFEDRSFVGFQKDKETLKELLSNLKKVVGDAKLQGELSISLSDSIKNWGDKTVEILENATVWENKIQEETKGFFRLCPKFLTQLGLRKEVAMQRHHIREQLRDKWTVENAIEVLKAGSYNSAKNSIVDFLLRSKSKETKICFWLCSLFPKGCAIDVEILLRYAIGLGLYSKAASNPIKKVRDEVWKAVEDLKSSFLLFEHEGKHFKMVTFLYDVVSKASTTVGVHLQLLSIDPGVDCLPESKAIFITSTSMAGPGREILLFNDSCKVSRVFLKRKEEYKMFSLNNQVNLRILHLEYWQLVEFPSLGKLKNIEILSFRNSDICDLPSELASLDNLKILDVYNCQKLHMIPSKLIKDLSRLEELCIGGPDFRKWPFEVARQEVSTSETSSFLDKISLCIPSVSNPVNIIFPELKRYEIAFNDSGFNHGYTISRALKVNNFILMAVKKLFKNVQHLHLDGLMDYQNLSPSSDMIGELNDLTFLSLRACPDMENIVDMTEQHVPDLAFSRLEELIIEEMGYLKKLCNGHPPRGFLQKLKKLTAKECPNMIFAIPAEQSLEELRVENCDKLQEILQNDGQFHAEQTQGYLFSSLRYLELIELPELSCLWSRSLGQVRLQCLKEVQIKGCNRLTYLFSLFLARNLVKLETLNINDCSSLKQVVKDDGSGVDEITVDTSAYFPCLEYLEIVDCNTLEYVFEVTAGDQILPKIETVKIKNCSKFQAIFQNEAIFQNDRLSKPNEESCFLPELREVQIKGCHRLTHLFSLSLALILKQLETLEIHDCRELKRVVSDDDHEPPSWPSLTFVKIADCQAMEYIFRIKSNELKELEELDISGCQQLKQVLHGDVTKLPCLQSLSLKGLRNLTAFSSRDSAFKLPSLQTLRVEACWKLANFTISFDVFTPVELEELCLNDVGNHATVVGREMQPNFEYLTIGNNEEIFQIQGGFLFWKLKKLILKELSKLQVIWKDEMRIVTLQNLTHLEVFKCNKLTSIFSLAFVQNLRQLTCLKVQACEKLEQIISRSQKSSSRVFLLESDCFPKLTEISIEDCNMLKNLLPFSLARLPKLKRLMVKDACKLKQIFKREDEEKARPRRKEDEKNIKVEEKRELPELEVLSFENLPEFLSFTTLGYYFVFPSLKSLHLIKCDKMAMRFFACRSNPPYVCAQIEKSLWPYHIDNLKFETTESECINPNRGDIEWNGHEQD